MGDYLTASSALTCPHGGTVTPVPANTAITLSGDPIVVASDTFPIVGCTFLPGAPHPCIRVKWVATALRGAADGAQALTKDSVGLCLAADDAVQGVVLILETQPKVSGL